LEGSIDATRFLLKTGDQRAKYPHPSWWVIFVGCSKLYAYIAICVGRWRKHKALDDAIVFLIRRGKSHSLLHIAGRLMPFGNFERFSKTCCKHHCVPVEHLESNIQIERDVEILGHPNMELLLSTRGEFQPNCFERRIICWKFIAVIKEDSQHLLFNRHVN